jgi:hypothetical protein
VWRRKHIGNAAACVVAGGGADARRGCMAALCDSGQPRRLAWRCVQAVAPIHKPCLTEHARATHLSAGSCVPQSWLRKAYALSRHSLSSSLFLKHCQCAVALDMSACARGSDRWPLQRALSHFRTQPHNMAEVRLQSIGMPGCLIASSGGDVLRDRCHMPYAAFACASSVNRSACAL